MTTKLVPNESGLVDIRIDAEDQAKGYVMVEDWDGNEHRINVRGNEGDIITLPVPKIRRRTATHSLEHKTKTKAS